MVLHNMGDEETAQSTAKKTVGLRPETKQFLDICNQYMKCRGLMDAKYHEVDECQRIANLEDITSSQMILQEDTTGGENHHEYYYKSEFQQQAIDGAPVKSLAELYEAAEKGFAYL